MNALSRWLVIAALVTALRVSVLADERLASGEAPMPRPRLTETLRVKAEELARETGASRTVTMDKFVVREGRLPTGPPKVQQTEGKFSITQGGYVLKKDGAKFSTEVGLWRHISVVPEWDAAHDQNVRIRMGLLRISW